MNIRGILLPVFLFMLLMQACTADVYVPVTHPTPLLGEKGELDGALYTSTNGTDLQAAYAISDRFGIGTDLNYMYRDFDEGSDFQKHKYGQISLIYFTDLKESEYRGLGAFGDPVYSRPEREFKLEFLGSIGLGEGEELRLSGFDDPVGEDFARGRYSKYSLQTNAAFGSDVFYVGISPRLSYVSYHDLDIPEVDINDTNVDADKTGGVFWEPAFFLGLRYENIKLESQIGTARVLGAQPAFGYEKFYMSMGVRLNFNVFN